MRASQRLLASFGVAVLALGVAVPSAASAAEPTTPVKQFADQEQLGLGLGSRVQFTVETPRIIKLGFATVQWGIRDYLDPRFSDARVEKFELVNPDDPADTFSFSADPTGWNEGYQESFEPSTNLLQVWLSQTALSRELHDSTHKAQYFDWYPRVTMSAVVQSVGDGAISNRAEGGALQLPLQILVHDTFMDGPDCVAVTDPDDPRRNNPRCLVAGLQASNFPEVWRSDYAVTRWGVASVLKVDDVTGEPLPGAKFEVYPAADPYAASCAAIPATASAPIEVTEGGVTATEFESDADGVVRVPGLYVDQDATLDGHRCYVVKETVAPEGYVLPTGGAEYTAIRVEVGSEAAGEPQTIANTSTPIAITEVAPVAPTVTQATCPVPGEPTAPTVVLPVTSGITYTVVGEVKSPSAVVIEARAQEGYQLTTTDAWTLADGVMSFHVKLDGIDCEKQPATPDAVTKPASTGNDPDATTKLATTGSDPHLSLWWGAGASLLFGAALVLANRGRQRV